MNQKNEPPKTLKEIKKKKGETNWAKLILDEKDINKKEENDKKT